MRLERAVREHLGFVLLGVPDKAQLAVLERRYWKDQQLQSDIRRFFKKERGPLTEDQFNAVMVRAHREAWPELLYTAWVRHRISNDLMGRRVGEAFAFARQPDTLLAASKWLTLFKAAGFRVDGVPAERPEGPRQVWRGSAPEHVRRMSWTPLREVAQAYARGEGTGAPGAGRVYTAFVEPSRVLAINDKVLLNPRETEWVIDARGLTVSEDRQLVATDDAA
ncbi:hypothetical protein [Streptomyces microflavus]|uniref:hypothetical protein n=1 Tax=Streptomyces microflavus TaxID=1919 RepID=UPI0033EDA962